MKKLLIMILILFLITGCGTKKEEKVTKKEKKEPEIVEEKYTDDNPIKVGLYDDYDLVKDYNTAKENFKDLVFSTYYTNDENLENTSLKINWNKYYNTYQNIDKYKIGYHISFSVGEEKIEKTILKPDTFIFNPYFYIYLYDDIHQIDGISYSHVEENEVQEETIFTTIKLYLVEVDAITSPIELTTFTYDDNADFDGKGNYRGISKYTININLQ